MGFNISTKKLLGDKKKKWGFPNANLNANDCPPPLPHHNHTTSEHVVKH